MNKLFKIFPTFNIKKTNKKNYNQNIIKFVYNIQLLYE